MEIQYKPGTGEVGSLTSEQEKCLEEFTETLKEKGLYDEIRHDIYYILRFLRACNFDPEKTLEMFENCENWRKEQNIDDLYKNFEIPNEEEVRKIYPGFYHHCDKEGRPVNYRKMGGLGVKGYSS